MQAAALAGTKRRAQSIQYVHFWLWHVEMIACGLYYLSWCFNILDYSFVSFLQGQKGSGIPPQQPAGRDTPLPPGSGNYPRLKGVKVYTVPDGPQAILVYVPSLVCAAELCPRQYGVPLARVLVAFAPRRLSILAQLVCQSFACRRL